ncbi:unnamed protein product [Anisakis simplex]|uniref:2',5'-phosphodiesterase 12 (inferred by orthology to a human protein) n=1 Tax=Anisakis simplex TaxID=6269 RepID=A0A0M3K496_ANISI|nr:unnamed protein product [Anisakis simplex]
MSRSKDSLITKTSMKIPDLSVFVWRDMPYKNKENGATNSIGRIPSDISIVFEYNVSEDDPTSTPLVALRRSLSDKFINTQQRLRLRLTGGTKKKRKGLKLNDADLVAINVTGVDNSELLSSTNEDIFFNNANVNSLRIGDKEYRLIRNALDCSSLSVALRPIVGCPLMASFDMRSGSKECEPVFHWYVGAESQSAVKPEEIESSDKGSRSFNLPGWQWRHRGRFFVPDEKDIGKRVCVLIDLGRDTITRCAISTELISNRPEEPYIFERRQADYCTEWQQDGFRVMSYNILAAFYLNLEQEQEDLFFPYCPKEYQLYGYRYPMLLREIPGYKADLIFLQEVDDRLQMRYLPALLREYGYECYFKKKAIQVNEGLMICFRRKHFRLLETYDMWLTDLLDLEKFPENEEIVNLLERDPAAKNLFVTRPTVLQVYFYCFITYLMRLAYLKHYIRNWNLFHFQLVSLGVSKDCDSVGEDGRSVILAANTHLYFDPRHEHIKVLQTLLCARYIARISAHLQRSNPNSKVYHLFGGDFNSTPEGGVYELLTQGEISKDNECWKCNEMMGGATMGTAFEKRNNIKFTSLVDNPEVTNYTRFEGPNGEERGFEGCLDYIWGSDNVKVNYVIPMPSDKLLSKHTALPSVIAPSDHLPIMCNIALE